MATEIFENRKHGHIYLTDSYFVQGDKAVKLYIEAYYDTAEAWRKELEEKDLLKDNPWTDEFQKIYYYLWHHEGRRAPGRYEGRA